MVMHELIHGLSEASKEAAFALHQGEDISVLSCYWKQILSVFFKKALGGKYHIKDRWIKTSLSVGWPKLVLPFLLVLLT